MGLFKKVFQNNNIDSTVSSHIETHEDIILLPTYHIVEDEAYGDGSSKYLISFIVNDAFRHMKSHAGEVEMVNGYNPEDEICSEVIIPYIAIHSDDMVYIAVKEFKESGTYKVTLTGKRTQGSISFTKYKSEMNN